MRENNKKNFLELPAIKITQPLGEFYAVSIKASDLLNISYTIRTEILDDKEESAFGLINKLTGTQRETKHSRLNEIKKYSETVDATFPNSIILGANYDEKTGLLLDEDDDKWYIEENNEKYTLIIPTNRRLASIIDGQHRLYGLKDSSKNNMELLCSVFLQLPMAYHAKIFMNINMNQKKVDRNLAYNLFHFEMDPGDMKSWSPDTLAVYFARILGTSENSSFKNKLKTSIFNESTTSSISFASVIDGIISLITTNPRDDRDDLHKSIKISRDRVNLSTKESSAPLRKLYIYKKDKTLYSIIFNFLNAFTKLFWEINPSIIMTKTLGIQSAFDVLKTVLKEDIEKNEFNKIIDIDDYSQKLLEKYSEDYFMKLFDNVNKINFDDAYFGVQSKARSRIKNVFFILCSNRTIDDLNIRNLDEEALLRNFISNSRIAYHIQRSENKNATMIVKNEGFCVLKGSKSNKEHHDTWSYSKLKNDLIEEGVLADKSTYLEFTKDYVFDSPSAAASIVLGKQAPGPLDWKDVDGISLKEK